MHIVNLDINHEIIIVFYQRPSNKAGKSQGCLG